MAASQRGTDTTLTKIFVGGLAWETQCETMRRYFEQFGDIVEAVVITDKNTGRSKGYGFVTFRDPEAARRACVDPAPIIDGRRTNCNLAVLGAHKSSPASPLYQGARFVPYVSDFSGHVYAGATPFGQPLPFTYQQGYPFPLPFGYPPYGAEVYGAQGMYPYMGPQFPAVYTPPSPTFHQQPDQTQGNSPLQQQQTQAQQQQHMIQGMAAPPPPSPPQPPLIGSLYIPPHMPHFVPVPFQSSAGLIPPTVVAPGPPSQRFNLPSPSAQPFTPGGSSDQSSG